MLHPEGDEMDYDVIVIGAGAGGEAAGNLGGELGGRVAAGLGHGGTVIGEARDLVAARANRA